jgi:hypothetical protein
MQARRRSAHLKDEVYRQMFRLEECRPGAELGLALALARAWVATDSDRGRGESRDWLRKVSPICLRMIEAATKAAMTAAGGQ